jgi:hypothetical protein
VRFAVPALDPRLEALVVALDDERHPVAETWRAVGEAAWRLGLRRPGYHVVRRLVQRVRELRVAKHALARAALGAVAGLASPYVVDLRRALADLAEAAAHESLVLKQHKPP